MTILEFVEKYKNMNSAKIKDDMLKHHVIRTYCPVIQKRYVLETMLNSSVVKKDNGFKYIDMMLSRINYTLGLVVLYTDLDMDRDEEGRNRNFDAYDALVENDIVIKLCEVIGEKEVTELSAINSTIIANFENSEGSLNQIISEAIYNVGQKFGIITATALEYLDEMTKDERLLEYVNK